MSHSPLRSILIALSVALGAAFGPVGCSDESDGGSTLRITTRFEVDASAVIPAMTPAPTPEAVAAGIADDVCGDGHIVCLTPTNLSGRIYAGGLMVGGQELGGPGYAITTIGANEDVRRRPDQGKTGTLAFDVGATTDISGDYTCCEGSEYPGADAAMVSRLEMNFDYLDVSFTVPAEADAAIAGQSFVIRQVYVDDTTAPDVIGTMHLGDKLIRRGDEEFFRWYDEEQGSHAERPATPLRAPNVELMSGEQGNPHYATVAISLSNDASMSFTKEEAERGGWLLRVAFDLDRAAIFELGDWAEADEEWDLIRAFHFVHEPGHANTSVRANLSKETIGAEASTRPGTPLAP